MKINLRLSGSLRLIYPDKAENIFIETPGPITIKSLLYKAGISPFVASIILIDGKKIDDKNKLIDKEEVEITIMGPVAGG
ncbi:ubiquitin family protein [Maledivibacter halophilus]|uniref:Sulfur carrier protein n=1 Tax=Maledivibacter halophilus TaxID=36842 RepID=A0A1T5IKH4_9FIRM|nr:MoaD/ThiS family protein [Maledivibacter halophilus]SKC39600.1 hypothetical protein SAMN02194393_00484 [Maledivibacter halophilus]